MSEKQTEAQRLADDLVQYHGYPLSIKAAQELRRLHAKNEALQSSYREAAAAAQHLQLERDQLLEALKWMVQRADEGGYPDGRCLATARAAIARATGQ